MIMYICYHNTKINALTKHKYESTLTPVRVPQASVDNHTYTYNKIGKLATINQDILDYELTYGVNEQRIEAIKKEYGQVVYTKQYINTASMEVKNGEELTYLYAEGQPFAIHKKTIEDEEEMYYLHLDHLGSIMSITNQSGSIVETRRYDAWGRPQDPNTWSYQLTPFGALNITDRGYTFHEHLIEFSLINMNGRMYDPVLGRVISPDNYIQAPDNTQSFNRYSYCFNNPLKYSDPSGDFAIVDSWLIGFVHGFFSTGSGRWSAGWNEANLRAGNDAKIWGGLLVSDPNKPFEERLWETVSRFTWQLPQTVGGFLTAQSVNTFGLYGGVSQVDYAYGATTVTTRSGTWGGVTQGSFIVGNNTLRADANNSLFQHEYGHYLQSQSMGWAYYPRVGIPSIMSSGEHDFHPVEQDANRRAFLYFNENEKGFQDLNTFNDGHGWDYWQNPLNIDGTGRRGQIVDFENSAHINALNNIKVNAKWYDHASWLLLPIGGPFWMGLINAGQYNN